MGTGRAGERNERVATKGESVGRGGEGPQVRICERGKMTKPGGSGRCDARQPDILSWRPPRHSSHTAERVLGAPGISGR